MKNSKLIFIWHAYGATYIAIFLLLAYSLFTIGLPKLLADNIGFTSESAWGFTLIAIMLFLSLLVNCVVAIFMTPLMEKLSFKLKQQRHSSTTTE